MRVWGTFMKISQHQMPSIWQNKKKSLHQMPSNRKNKKKSLSLLVIGINSSGYVASRQTHWLREVEHLHPKAGISWWFASKWHSRLGRWGNKRCNRLRHKTMSNILRASDIEKFRNQWLVKIFQATKYALSLLNQSSVCSIPSVFKRGHLRLYSCEL